MWNPFKFTLKLLIFYLFAVNIRNYSAFAIFDAPLKKPLQQLAILNAFAGCNIRLINFRGLNVDFEVVKEPILLIRYLSPFRGGLLYPFELGSDYPKLKSAAHNRKPGHANYPRTQKANSYMGQTLSESFHLRSKNLRGERLS